MTIVYVDVLLIVNFMVNFVLLRAAALLTTRPFWGCRAAVAALAGALSALILFAPPVPVAIMALYKLAVCAVMVLIAFPFAGRTAFLSSACCLFAVSFLFSGLMLALYLVTAPAGMLLINGSLYFDISALALLLSTAACYLMTTTFAALLRRRVDAGELYEVVIVGAAGACMIPALLDTGNHLVEPFSGLPALVCGQCDLKNVLPEGFDPLLTDAVRAQKMGFRLIPYVTVGGQGVLPAFVPVALRIRTPNGETALRPGCYVAVSPTPIGNGHYRAILNPAMLATEQSDAFSPASV